MSSVSNLHQTDNYRCQDPPRFVCVRCAIAVYWPIQIKTNDVRGMWYADLRQTNYVSYFEVENFVYCYEPIRGMVDDLDRFEIMHGAK